MCFFIFSFFILIKEALRHFILIQTSLSHFCLSLSHFHLTLSYFQLLVYHRKEKWLLSSLKKLEDKHMRWKNSSKGGRGGKVLPKHTTSLAYAVYCRIWLCWMPSFESLSQFLLCNIDLVTHSKLPSHVLQSRPCLSSLPTTKCY